MRERTVLESRRVAQSNWLGPRPVVPLELIAIDGFRKVRLFMDALLYSCLAVLHCLVWGLLLGPLQSVA
jgi:hypothetical protein